MRYFPPRTSPGACFSLLGSLNGASSLYHEHCRVQHCAVQKDLRSEPTEIVSSALDLAACDAAVDRRNIDTRSSYTDAPFAPVDGAAQLMLLSEPGLDSIGYLACTHESTIILADAPAQITLRSVAK